MRAGRAAAGLLLLIAGLAAAAEKKPQPGPCPRGGAERVECAEVRHGLWIGRWRVFGVFTRRELRGTGDPARGAAPIAAYPLADLVREVERRKGATADPVRKGAPVFVSSPGDCVLADGTAIPCPGQK